MTREAKNYGDGLILREYDRVNYSSTILKKLDMKKPQSGGSRAMCLGWSKCVGLSHR